jgi:hypothetical protein
MRSVLRRLDRQLAALEGDAEAGRQADQPPGRRHLQDVVYVAMHPDFFGEPPNDACKGFLWPMWHMVQLGDRFGHLSRFCLPRLDAIEPDIIEAIYEWAADHEGFRRWCPVNPVTVHWVKAILRPIAVSYREIAPHTPPLLGVDRAQPIDDFFRDGPLPWSRSFSLDPAAWPVGVLERVRESQSLCPDVAPAFDWTKIGRLTLWHGGTDDGYPFPRGADGRPVRGHFRPAKEETPCGA